MILSTVNNSIYDAKHGAVQSCNNIALDFRGMSPTLIDHRQCPVHTNPEELPNMQLLRLTPYSY